MFCQPVRLSVKSAFTNQIVSLVLQFLLNGLAGLSTKALCMQIWSERLGGKANITGDGSVQQGCDIQEGADETDEGGGKRLLRSHTAAAAADLDREHSVDRTGWSG